MNSATITAICLIASANPASSEDVLLFPVIHTSGGWELRKGSNPFTDEPECLATYKPDAGVGAEANSLYIGGSIVSGELESYELRFGDATPEPVRKATGYEKQNGIIILQGDEFNH
ncbi:hypothetical protein NS365_23260, partial [Aureimonas ureilytica]